ncbi:MAG: aldo/keto reductase [Candidatus Latescibacterota bacterium]|nr:MAG: aldo/keto reductase [Candidatus Latescibacterota bacterium]
MTRDDSTKGRRDFLKKSVTGIAGMTGLPTVLGSCSKGVPEAEPIEDTAAAPPAEAKAPAAEGKIITRKFGNSGLELPIVSMGVMDAENPDLVRAALDAGIVHLDTANVYQGGRNEEMIGGVIKDVPRDSFVIATKIYEDQDRRSGMFTENATKETFMEKFEQSLGRLGLDYVEILYLHSIGTREATLYEPYLELMQKLKDEGRIRLIGVSTHSKEPEVIRAAIESKVYDVVLTAYNFRQPHVAEVEAAMKEASDAGLSIVAMKTQAGVYWDRERQRPINMKAALKWALQNDYVHTAIPGITTFDQLELDVSVMKDIKLTPAEELDLKQDDQMGLFCDQCRKCVGQCRMGVEIPTVMRSYMYAYGYRNLRSAKETLETAGLTGSPCDQCGSCTVDCTMKFDVKSKITDIARLRDVPSDLIA